MFRDGEQDMVLNKLLEIYPDKSDVILRAFDCLHVEEELVIDEQLIVFPEDFIAGLCYAADLV